jgi:ABC-type transport system substrate-binding protein
VPWRSFAALTGVLAATVAVAACGGNDHRGGGGAPSSAQSRSATAIKPGKPGGRLTVLWSADIDFLDPGLTYYTFGYMVQYAVNRTLYSYKPDSSERPVPDLATGPPEISSDNTTITIHIKTGVQYAPPVNREVKAKDIKYAFERAFSKEVPSGYAGAYFNSIVGTPTKANAGNIKPIPGIETPDDTTIVFHLKTPSATLVSQALVMPITVPVPQEYAARGFESLLRHPAEQLGARGLASQSRFSTSERAAGGGWHPSTTDDLRELGRWCPTACPTYAARVPRNSSGVRRPLEAGRARRGNPASSGASVAGGLRADSRSVAASHVNAI